jgi:peptide-methionine (S)-S-oxide reductase
MGTTGHAEVIKLEFDPKVISYERLLDVFFALHDATQVNGQGYDVGTEYRSVILTTTSEQFAQAQQRITSLKDEGEDIVTELKPLERFYDAASYHQKFYELNPTTSYCMVIVSPKLDKLREKFPELLKPHKRA